MLTTAFRAEAYKHWFRQVIVSLGQLPSLLLKLVSIHDSRIRRLPVVVAPAPLLHVWLLRLVDDLSRVLGRPERDRRVED